MATTEKKYQIIQKTGEDDYLLLYPETTADNVKVDANGILATDVQAALEEINDNVAAITGGGVVTGVKGGAEESYRLGNVNITKENIGLGNVDNTSDANKPISSATQSALDLKEDKANLKALAYKDSLTNVDVGLGNVSNDAQVKRSEMGANNGVATLDDSGKVPAAQLPSYVDDVVEGTYVSATVFNDEDGSPVTPESGKIYIDTSTNKEYRWSGTQFAIISESLALGETSATAYAGNKGKQNADNIAALQTTVGEIQTKNTQQDTAISAAQDAAEAAQTAADTADDKAEAAQAAAATNATSITNIVNGTTTVAKATAAGTATNATNASAAAKLSTARNISLTGDATATVSFDGSQNASGALTLANSGVSAGSYSAVTVDAKGRVTAGAQLVEVGTTGQSEPSATLAVGGIFFKEI